jgi:hypothetical protein
MKKHPSRVHYAAKRIMKCGSVPSRRCVLTVEFLVMFHAIVPFDVEFRSDGFVQYVTKTAIASNSVGERVVYRPVKGPFVWLVVRQVTFFVEK